LHMSKKTDIVRDTVRRFYHLPVRTIARYLINEYGDLFDGDLEKARTAVRYALGKCGERNREYSTHKELFRDDAAKVQMPRTWRVKRTPYRLPAGLWGVLSDVHIPMHEPEPLEGALQYMEAQKVDGLFLNGDMFDCASVSYWPSVKRDFNKELTLFIDFIDVLRYRFSGKPIVYKPGNHEYRLPRYFLAHAPELAATPFAAMETVMGFEERDIEFLDYFQPVMAGKLPVLHGHEIRNIQRTVNPARGLFLKAKNFAACSHCHTTSSHTTRDITGNVITTWSFGCLCDLQPEYNPFGNDWNWGFALINVHDNGSFEVENKRIMPSGNVK